MPMPQFAAREMVGVRKQVHSWLEGAPLSPRERVAVSRVIASFRVRHRLQIKDIAEALGQPYMQVYQICRLVLVTPNVRGLYISGRLSYKSMRVIASLELDAQDSAADFIVRGTVKAEQVEGFCKLVRRCDGDAEEAYRTLEAQILKANRVIWERREQAGAAKPAPGAADSETTAQRADRIKRLSYDLAAELSRPLEGFTMLDAITSLTGLRVLEKRMQPGIKSLASKTGQAA